MKTILFPAPAFDDLSHALLASRHESCALLIGDAYENRIISVETYTAPRTAYRHRNEDSAVVSPEFLVPIVAEARTRNSPLIFVHTHPRDTARPRFSTMDDEGEQLLSDFFQRRVPGQPHMALVISPGGASARELGTQNQARVLQVGATIADPSDAAKTVGGSELWDRQVRAFGERGQARLKTLRIAIVGAGGTGSVVAQQLAHLGVGELMIIDPDIVEISNLNRLVGAAREDVGKRKAEVIAQEVERTGLGTTVHAVPADVRDGASILLLTTCDAIFSCTDSHSSRAVINQLAFQYLIPAFDVGVAIGTAEGRVTHVAGRAQMLAPGLACLVCGNALNGNAIRQELMSDKALAADPYFDGAGVAQPAVISINSTMASLLVTMFLAAFTGAPLRARLQYYDGLTGRVRAASQRPDPTCVVCSRSGALAKGSRWPILTGVAA